MKRGMEREHYKRRLETNLRRRKTTPKCEEPRKPNLETEGTSRLRGVINIIVGKFVGGSLSSTKKRPYLELQTSKWDNLGSLGKLRRRSKTFLFTT
ncbi:hypothetical protein CR513_16647, partial [Mucuna pruriens]